MKPRAIDLAGAESPREAMRRIVETRLEEASALSAALEGGESVDLHQFRIACKRLRYALERCSDVAPVLAASAPQLERVQDALGEAHDCDILLGRLPPGMPKTGERLEEQRRGAVRRCVSFWNDARVLVSESLRYYAPSDHTI